MNKAEVQQEVGYFQKRVVIPCFVGEKQRPKSIHDASEGQLPTNAARTTISFTGSRNLPSSGRGHLLIDYRPHSESTPFLGRHESMGWAQWRTRDNQREWESSPNTSEFSDINKFLEARMNGRREQPSGPCIRAWFQLTQIVQYPRKDPLLQRWLLT